MLLLKSNRISELGPLKAPNLLELDLEGNTIAKMDTFENFNISRTTDRTKLIDPSF